MKMISANDKERMRTALMRTGACAVGFATAREVTTECARCHDSWIAAGYNAGMEYMGAHRNIRNDPRLLLEGARTVISLAFPYTQPRLRPASAGHISEYAYGRDYHKEIRSRLRPAITSLPETEQGAQWRICIDSAPIFERYWAQQAGIGTAGDNGAIIIPGYGSKVFLTEIITTLIIEPDAPATGDCGHCGACRRSCPANAILDNGIIDTRRCISYLSIEHKGEWDSPEAIAAMDTEPGRNTIFGCDICISVCPHNRNVRPTDITAFLPSKAMASLNFGRIMTINDEEFLRDFAGTPLMRAGLAGLRRNISPRHYTPQKRLGTEV